MIHLEHIIHQFAANAETIRALVAGVSDEQATWKPDPDTWSIAQVMEHLYNEERLDFRQHLQEMFSDPPQPWGALHTEYITAGDCREALARFLRERQDSIAWLKALGSPDWDVAYEVPFGPTDDIMALSAGDVLFSWADHDLVHLRQMIRLQHGWLEKETTPYSREYAGGQW